MKSSSNVKITVIVPVFNGGAVFDYCLKGLKAAHREPHEILIVGDGEGDGSWRKAEGFGFKGIRQDVNGGPAKARNFAAKEAEGEWLLFIDADIEVQADLLDQAVKAIKEHPEYAGFIGSYDDEPGAQDFLSQYKNLFHHYVHQNAPLEAHTFWGGCGLIRKDVFLAVGGFDAVRYPLPSIEDIELGYRLTAAGHRLAHFNGMLVKHWKRWGAWNLIKTDLFLRARLWTALMMEYGGVGEELNAGPKYKIGLIASFLLPLCMIGAILNLWFLFPAIACFATFFFVNLDLFRFFHRLRGGVFAFRTVIWRYIYDLYSGIGFGLGLAKFYLDGSPSAVQLEGEPLNTET